jgi:hypothetical protein
MWINKIEYSFSVPDLNERSQVILALLLVDLMGGSDKSDSL